jgi:hypothetical protein
MGEALPKVKTVTLVEEGLGDGGILWTKKGLQSLADRMNERETAVPLRGDVGTGPVIGYFVARSAVLRFRVSDKKWVLKADFELLEGVGDDFGREVFSSFALDR